jgi:hypothetical protein
MKEKHNSESNVYDRLADLVPARRERPASITGILTGLTHTQLLSKFSFHH